MTATQWAVIAVASFGGIFNHRAGFSVLFFYALSETMRLAP